MQSKPAKSDMPGVRERIVESALELINEQGIAALTQTRVAKHAGVRQSHLTYYFPTRHDLLKQTVVSGVAALLTVLESPADAGSKSLARFREALEVELTDRRVPRMMAGLVAASEEERSLKPWLEQFELDLLDRMRLALANRGVRPTRADLEMFQATIVGALHLDLAASSDTSGKRTRAILRRAFNQLIKTSRCTDKPNTQHRRSTASVSSK